MSGRRRILKYHAMPKILIMVLVAVLLYVLAALRTASTGQLSLIEKHRNKTIAPKETICI